MWKLETAGDSANPYLRSLNGHQGRNTWTFQPEGGTPELRAQVEQLRAAFTANRLKQRHSSDELLRLQCAGKIASKLHTPPAEPLPGGLPTAQRVAEHLRGAISFYAVSYTHLTLPTIYSV